MREHWKPPAAEHRRSPERKREYTAADFERDVERAVTSCTRVGEDLLSGLKRGAEMSLAIGVPASIATLLVGNSPLGDRIGDAIDMAKAEIYEEKNISRVDAAFDGAARALRADTKFDDEFSPEVIDAVAKELENFSAKRVYGAIAKESGVSVAELAMLNSAERVVIYSDKEVDAFVEHQQERRRTLHAPQDAVRYAKRVKSDAEFARDASGMAADEKVIFLNISNLSQHGGAPLEHVAAATREVIYHEFLHCFPVPQYGNDEAARLFYEGETEVRSGLLTKAIDGKVEYGHPSYRGGPAAAAALAIEAVGDEYRAAMWKGYVRGDARTLPILFDEKFGDKAFDTALHRYELFIADGAQQKNSKWDYDGLYENYQQSVIVFSLIETLGDKRDEIVERANEVLQTGKIIPIRGKTRNGVMLVSENWNGQVANGLITMYNPSNGYSRHVIFGGGSYDTNFQFVPDTNAVYVNVDLDGYARGKNLEDRSFEQRGAAVVKLIKSYDADLKDLRNR